MHSLNLLSDEILYAIDLLKIEYYAVGDTWWQPLLSYGK